MSTPIAGADPHRVFVIHGRNENARKGFFTFLRAIGLEPIEWAQAITMTSSGSPYIGEVLDHAFGAAQAVVVLQTPDDVAYLHESLTYPGDPDTAAQLQPRPNVLYEAGMAMGRDPDHTIIVELGHVRVFSDIHGRHTVRLDNTVAKRQELAIRLQTAGCAVDLSGTDWHDAGDLTPPAPPGGGLPMGRKLPSAETAGLPRLTARFDERGGNKFSNVVVTNHGPGDIYELNAKVTDDEEGIFRATEDLPVPRLPVSKSVVVMQRLPITLGQRPHTYFTVKLTGKTADGTPVEVDEFVSRG